jgi:lambda family phage minor tail protein L
MTVPVSELQKIAPSSIIELYELHLDATLHGASTIYRFHAGTNQVNNGDIVWNANSYLKFPVEVTGFEYNGGGQLPRPKLQVSNAMSYVTAILLTVNDFNTGNDLIGAKFIRIRTLARYLDAVNFVGNVNPYGTPDPTAEFPQEIYFIDRKTSENLGSVEWDLAAAFDLVSVKAPKRQCIANICQWKYRSTECSYAGTNYFDINDNAVATQALDVCGKKLNSCSIRFGENNELPYGSFPGIGIFSV